MNLIYIYDDDDDDDDMLNTHGKLETFFFF